MYPSRTTVQAAGLAALTAVAVLLAAPHPALAYDGSQAVKKLLKTTTPQFSSVATPVAVTGYNADVVWNGTAADAPATHAFDQDPSGDSGYTFFSSGGSGLPADGAFTSQTGSGAQYQLQSYTANNALMLDNGSPSGVLTLTHPNTFQALDLLTATGSGGNVVSGAFHYSDGTSSSFQFYSHDWFYGSNAAISNLGRVFGWNSGSPGYDAVGSGNPNLYEAALIPDSTRTLDSISFNLSNPGGGYTGILGVSGAAPVPEASTTVSFGLLLVLGAGGLAWNARRKAKPSPE